MILNQQRIDQDWARENGFACREIASHARLGNHYQNLSATGHTDTIGQAMQIIGADQPVDVNSLKPVLTAELDAGQVAVGWTKQGMDGIEIQVDRGTSFVFLAIGTIPDYTDTAPMSAVGQSALWKYKAIYLQADQRVGQWSDVVSGAVAG
jgi:hypothetical protein